MKQSVFLLLASLFMATFSIVLAQAMGSELSYYGVESSINDDMSIKTVLTIKFAEPVNSSEFLLDYRAFNMSTQADFDSAECRLSDEGSKSRVTCTFTGMTVSKKLLTLTFYTRDGIRVFQNKGNFTTDYGISMPASVAFIIIKIPQNTVLSEEPANQSYSPSNGKILTDGKLIMVYWEKDNVTADDLKFSVSYSIPSAAAGFSNLFVVSIAGIVILSMIAVAIYVRRGEGMEKITAEVVASVLNTDEKKVVDILAKHGGKSGQKIIVRESDFSKAKVSRLVKGLKSRGVVDIEPISGRENRIILRFEKKPEQKPEKPERIADPVIDTQADVEEI
jgi:uncharacterized membrane protein